MKLDEQTVTLSLTDIGVLVAVIGFVFGVYKWRDGKLERFREKEPEWLRLLQGFNGRIRAARRALGERRPPAGPWKKSYIEPVAQCMTRRQARRFKKACAKLNRLLQNPPTEAVQIDPHNSTALVTVAGVAEIEKALCRVERQLRRKVWLWPW